MAMIRKGIIANKMYKILLIIASFLIAGCGDVTLTKGSIGVVAVDDTASISWVAPMTNIDGSPLIDLDGYRIYYGLIGEGNLTHFIDLQNEQLTSYKIEGLTSGNWFFAMTAYNTNGIESEYSEEVTKNIQ